MTSKPKNSIGGIASANSGFVSGVAWIPTETIWEAPIFAKNV